MDFDLYYTRLILPLLRLLAAMSLGLLLASLLESLRWTRFVARLAAPLTRAGHFGQVAAASFALAFISPAAANSLLAEAWSRGELSRRALILANLFNASPSFLAHLPSLFLLVFAFLGPLAFVYVGLVFAASALRSACTLLAGRLLLPVPPENQGPDAARPERRNWPGTWRATGQITWRRFKKRLRKLLVFTVPVYILFFGLQQAGLFTALEGWLAAQQAWLGFLNPKSLGVVALHLAAEQGAALAAAAALADSGALTGPEIIMALLAGNIVSSPLRALRHQLPAYAGYFAPALALRLVLANQACRAASLACLATAYFFYAF